MTVVVECPADQKEFFPLIYLGAEALSALYPYTLEMIKNDMEGGEVLAQLVNFSNAVRAYLQHHNIYVD